MYWVWLLPRKNSAQQFTVFQGFCQAALPPHNVREPSLGFQNLARMARPSWHLSVTHLCTMQSWSSHPVQQVWIQVGILNYAPITAEISGFVAQFVLKYIFRPRQTGDKLFNCIKCSVFDRPFCVEMAILKCLGFFRVTGCFLISSSVFQSLLPKCLHIDYCQLSWFSEKCLIWIDLPSRALKYLTLGKVTSSTQKCRLVWGHVSSMEGSQLLLVLRFKLAIEDRLRPEKFVIRQVRVKGEENASQFIYIYRQKLQT